MLKTKRDTCRNNMASILDTGTYTDKQLYSECLVFIDTIKQVRYSKPLWRHVNKFNKLKLKQTQGGIHDRLFNNNDRAPTHSWDNHMNDNNNNNNNYPNSTVSCHQIMGGKLVLYPTYRSSNITSSQTQICHCTQTPPKKETIYQ